MIFAPKTIALAFTASTCVSLLVGGELYCRRSDPLWGMTERFACRAQRPGLGGGFRPNCSSPWVRRVPSGVIFRCDFRTDAYGRRVTPESHNRPRSSLSPWRNKPWNTLSALSYSSFASCISSILSSVTGSRPKGTTSPSPPVLFLGCSFTLGAGVNQSETLPAVYSRLTGTRCLNYGASGYGPQQALRILETVTDVELGGHPALAVYTLIAGHAARANGAWQVVGSFGANFPDARSGFAPFSVSHPWRVWLATLAMRSALLRRLPEDRDPALTVELLQRAARVARERWGARLVVLEWPGTDIEIEGVETLRPWVDVSERFLDGHPRAAAYRRVGEWLVKQDLFSVLR